MRKLFIAGLFIAGLTLYSCHSSNADKYNENEVTSNAPTPPPTTMEGNPLPKETPAATASAESKGGIDVNAKSDSKGVGKFTDANIKVGSAIDAAMAAKGKAVFQASCTACHTSTTQKLVGPGLKGITKIRTPQWIMNMISDPVKMTHNDPIAEALLQDMNGVQMTNQNVGDEGAREILEFLRQNDAQ